VSRLLAIVGRAWHRDASVDVPLDIWNGMFHVSRCPSRCSKQRASDSTRFPRLSATLQEKACLTKTKVSIPRRSCEMRMP